MYRVILILYVLAMPGLTYCQPPTYNTAQQTLINEHVYGGLPSTTQLLFRNGYVLEYDESEVVSSDAICETRVFR